MNTKTIYHSILTLSFWMIASLGIMQHTKAYFTPEIIQFFDGKHSLFDIERLFTITLYAFLSGMFIASIAVRYVLHRHMLCLGLCMSIIGIIITYFFVVLGIKVSVMSSVIIFGLGCGFLPISSVCAVMKWLTMKVKTSTHQVFHVLMAPKTALPPVDTEKEVISSEDILIDDDETTQSRSALLSAQKIATHKKEKISQKAGGKQQQKLLAPVGIYLVVPIIIGITILSKQLLGVILAFVFLFGVVYVILLKSKNFGNFTSRPSAKLIGKTLTHNYMLYILIVLFIVVSCVDVISIYYLPYLLRQYFQPVATVQIIPLIMLLLFVVRILMIIFAELSLVQVPMRRLVLFSHISISLGILVLVFATQINSKVILLFSISSSLSVVFPAIIKGIARFLPFAMLPFVLVCLSFVGTAVMLFSRTQLFLYLENTHNFATFYIITAGMLVVISLIFFIISYRRGIIQT